MTTSFVFAQESGLIGNWKQISMYMDDIEVPDGESQFGYIFNADGTGSKTGDNQILNYFKWWIEGDTLTMQGMVGKTECKITFSGNTFTIESGFKSFGKSHSTVKTYEPTDAPPPSTPSSENPMADLLDMSKQMASSSMVNSGLYVNEEAGFEIDIPIGFNGSWTGDMLMASEGAQSEDSGNLIALIMASHSKPTIMVIISEAEEGEEAVDIVNMELEDIKRQMIEDSEEDEDIQMTVHSVTKENFSGHKWIKIVGETTTQLGKIKNTAYHTTVGKRSVILSYSAPASEWNRVELIFEENHKTFKLK